MANYTGSEPGVPLSMQSATTVVNNSPIKIFYSNAALNSMLLMPGSLGVRFYPSGTDSTDSLIAVGVDSNMKEMMGGNVYIKSGSTLSTTAMDRPTAKNNVGVENFHAYFSKGAINEILGKPGVVGIHIYQDKIRLNEKNWDTLVMVGVKLENGERVDLTGAEEYVETDLPCPDYCGTEDLYT